MNGSIMSPLDLVDENTPAGTRVIVVADGGMSLLIGEFRRIACGWVHVAGKGGEETLCSSLDVFAFPEKR